MVWRHVDPFRRCKERHASAHLRVRERAIMRVSALAARRARKRLSPLHDKITAWFEDWYRELQRQKARAQAGHPLQPGSLVAHKEFTHVRHVASVPNMQERQRRPTRQAQATTNGDGQ